MTEMPPAEPPVRAQRPVPLVGAPEGTSDPARWSTEDAAQPRRTSGHGDDLVAQRQAAERDDREGRASGDDPGTGPSRTDDESGYSTERAQGAAQPGPAQEEAP
jgi:hypothetical protein